MTKKERADLVRKYAVGLRKSTNTNRKLSYLALSPELLYDFVEGIKKHGPNPKKVHDFLLYHGRPVSYEFVRNHIQRVFGRYEKPGRPPKYLGKGRQLETASQTIT